jgi:hypothetical protein
MPSQPDDVRSPGKSRHPAARQRLPFLREFNRSLQHILRTCLLGFDIARSFGAFLLSCLAIAPSLAWLCRDRSVARGRYWCSNLLVFRLSRAARETEAHVYRRIDGEWYLVHRHADLPPSDQRARDQGALDVRYAANSGTKRTLSKVRPQARRKSA